VLLVVIEVTLTVLIAWCAWTWPKGHHIWRAAMKPWAILCTILGMLTGVGCTPATPEAQAKPAPALARMPRDLEIRFALSAAPPHLRRDATTYVLDPERGYAVDRKGANGVSCIVVRSDWQFTKQVFRDDVFWPVCYDAEGSKTLLQDYLLAARLRARGMSAGDVHEAIAKDVGSPALPNASRTGVAYMIAPVMRGYTQGPEPVTMNMPHYMFYAPNVKDADIGGNGFSEQYPFVLSMHAGRDDYIIVLVGQAEKERILDDSQDLLTELCEYRKYLCTTPETRARTPVS